MRSIVQLIGIATGVAALGACASAGTAAPQNRPGREPSASAKMVCAKEARADITEALGVAPIKVSVPTWVAHQFSCNYEYEGGTVALSVKELNGGPETTSYYNSLATKLGKTDAIAIGQGGFFTTSGSVVVRKDNKVLNVDTSRLPTEFGAPPQARNTVALTIATTIMGCWTGT